MATKNKKKIRLHAAEALLLKRLNIGTCSGLELCLALRKEIPNLSKRKAQKLFRKVLKHHPEIQTWSETEVGLFRLREKPPAIRRALS
jgi:hypothetical protein